MHLVEFSQGKLNEISLNVLDKKSSASVAPEKKGFFSRFGARSNKGSYEGFGSSIALESGENTANENRTAGQRNNASGVTRGKKARGKHATPQQRSFGKQKDEVPFLPNATGFNAQEYEEIAHRRKRRARSRMISISLVIIAVLVLAGVGVSFLYQEFEKSRSNRALIDTACSYIEQSDQTLVAIDEFFAQPFDENTIEQAEKLQDEIPSALELLQDAKKYAEWADQAIEGSNSDREAAECAYNTIVSRETMFDVANQKLALDIEAKKAMDGLGTIETAIDDTQYLLAQAAVAVEQTSPETVAQSTEWLKEAQEKLEAAQATLNDIITWFPDGDFSCYSNYIAKRLEEIEYGLESNEAILIQDRKTAESYNDKYNQADRESVELVRSFPEVFAAPLVEAYEQRTQGLNEQFTKLRNDIGSNDSVLRDYLGNDTQA